MTEPRLSAATRSLLRAAKADGPGAVARAKVWTGVAGAVGGAAGAGAAGAAGTVSTAPGAIASGGAAATKMLALGTLLGGTVTVGLAAMLLHLGPAPRELPGASSAPVAAFAPDPASPAEQLDPPPPPLAPVLAGPSPATALPTTAPLRSVAFPVPPPPRPRAGVAAPAAAPRPTPASTPPDDDTLGREASLVLEARGALGRGDARGALQAVRAARMLPSHQLGPEELAVEAQALRALGKDDQARDVDSTLRKQFPESALGH